MATYNVVIDDTMRGRGGRKKGFLTFALIIPVRKGSGDIGRLRVKMAARNSRAATTGCSTNHQMAVGNGLCVEGIRGTICCGLHSRNTVRRGRSSTRSHLRKDVRFQNGVNPGNVRYGADGGNSTFGMFSTFSSSGSKRGHTFA